jgi:hypothetical protein
VLVVLVTLWAGRADADRVGRLIQILRTDPSYKVRLKVVIALDKLKSRRAVPALIRALRDEHYTVRGVAAAALAGIGDQRALPALRKRLKDRHGFVRTRAKMAIKRLILVGRGRFYIKVGKVRNRSGKGGTRPSRMLKEALLTEFARVPGVVVHEKGEGFTAAELRRRKLRGFTLNGALLRLKRHRTAGGLTLSCSLRVSLITFPGESLKALYSGEARMSVPVRIYRRKYEQGFYKELFAGAAQEARKHIVGRFLALQ